MVEGISGKNLQECEEVVVGCWVVLAVGGWEVNGKVRVGE